eukprot:SAG11_NODE_36150_length_263_cov_0.628049_1_plen_29_part_10
MTEALRQSWLAERARGGGWASGTCLRALS